MFYLDFVFGVHRRIEGKGIFQENVTVVPKKPRSIPLRLNGLATRPKILAKNYGRFRPVVELN